MKKRIALLLAVSMLLSLTACGGGTTTESTPTPDEAAETDAEVSEDAEAEDTAEGTDAEAEDLTTIMTEISGIWPANTSGYDLTLYDDGTLEFQGAGGTWEVSDYEIGEWEDAVVGNNSTYVGDRKIEAEGTMVLDGSTYDFRAQHSAGSSNYNLDIYYSDTYDQFTSDSGDELWWTVQAIDLKRSRWSADSAAAGVDVFAEQMGELSATWASNYAVNGEAQPDYDITLHEDGTLEFQGAGGVWEILQALVADEGTYLGGEGHIALIQGCLDISGTVYDFKIIMNDETYSYHSLDIYQHNGEEYAINLGDSDKEWPATWALEK